MARWKPFPPTTFEISHFQPVHCACKNPISAKVFHRFSKSFPELGDFEGGHLGGKFEARRYFTFAMGRWKLCVSTTFEILPLSTCTLCQQKSYSSKAIQPIFEIFTSARRCGGWAIGRKVSGAQIYYFWNSKVKSLRIDNIWNFATFNLYTVPAKILYLPRGSTDFRNLCFSSIEDVDGGHMFGKSQVRRYGTFAMARWKLCACTTFEISHCQPVHCGWKNPISPKVFNRFSKS